MSTGFEDYNKAFEYKLNTAIKASGYPCLKAFANSMINLTPATIFDYVNMVSKFLRTVDKQPEELTYDDYINYFVSIKNLTKSSQILAYHALRKFSKYLFVTGKAASDVMINIDRPKYTESIKTKKKRENGYLNHEELKEYLYNVRNGIADKPIAHHTFATPRDFAIVQVFLNTGMRLSALYRLDIDDIDLDKKTIIAFDKEEEIHEYIISDDLSIVLQEYLDVRKDYIERNEIKDVDSKALFLGRFGKRMDQTSIRIMIGKYSYTMEKKVSPHRLRATYGTMLIEQTHDIYFVQQCMGHKSPVTTELYVRGQQKENKYKAAEIMSKIVF